MRAPALPKFLLFTAAVLIVFSIAASVPASAQLSGAIFTTTSGGTTVNGNIYANKTDVYLDGGPQPNAPCTSSGLPDGDYYFQVTNPSGSLLLSSDAITERAVHVSGGVITAYLGSTHATSAGKCPGSIAVALFPYLDTDNPGGEYKAWMTPVGSYVPDAGFGFPSNSVFGFVPSSTKTDNFKVNSSGGCPDCPPQGPTISGIKFYDTNTNGHQDAGEPGIQGWQIDIAGPNNFSSNTTTDSTGHFFFLNLDPGTYGVCEVLPAAQPQWYPTTSTSRSGIVVPPDSTDTAFGNVCVGFGGGLTLGFWSNKNGQNLITAANLCLLDSLYLVNGSGANFDPVAGCPSPTSSQLSTGKSNLATWLKNGTAVNMSYMLSVQLATMELNVAQGFVDGNAFIYAPGSNSANAAGFATVSAIMAEANASLQAHPVVLSGNSVRSYEEALKNALDQANNNNTFVQAAGTCAVNYNNTESCAATP
jgi:hypothetical protein